VSGSILVLSRGSAEKKRKNVEAKLPDSLLVLFFLVKRIGNGAVIIGLSLHPNKSLDDGI
jgi:hypothetical protein